MRIIPFAVWMALLLVPSASLPEPPDPIQSEVDTTQTILEIFPSETDPAIRRFNEAHVVILDPVATASAQLVVFMPGTKGRPRNAIDLLRVVAHQGYRAIGLEYDDEPAVVLVCPNNPNETCSEDFRRGRIYGDDAKSVASTPRAETIVNRLVKLLIYLDQRFPDAHWSNYFGNGEPVWSTMVVSGLSQGAGMAAFIAKEKPVARVVLFSSPWDYSDRTHSLAPWIGAQSVTPPDRWFAEYHAKENTAPQIALAYKLLRIPPDHVLIFNLEIPPAMRSTGHGNPFHGSTIRLLDYEPEWRILFGHSP